MTFDPSQRGIFSHFRRDGFLGADQPDLPAVGPELPDSLVNTTVWAALRIARDRVSPSRVLSRRATWLVGEALFSLAGYRW